MKFLAVVFTAAFLSSCMTMPMPPGGGIGGQPAPQPAPQPQPGPDPIPTPPPTSRTPRTGWHLSSHRSGYDLDVIVNGREYHVDTGGEHFDPHPASTRSDGVSPGALSAYEIHGPDGEDTIYWIEQNGDSLQVYSRQFDPYSARWGRERRLRTIRL